jgi:CBS domain-containing protein
VANGISAVPVVAIDGSVVGIISEGDLMRRAVSGAERKRSWRPEIFSLSEQLMAEFVKAHGLCCLLRSRQRQFGLPVSGLSKPVPDAARNCPQDQIDKPSIAYWRDHSAGASRKRVEIELVVTQFGRPPALGSHEQIFGVKEQILGQGQSD